MVFSYFQLTRSDCKIESFYKTGRQKKIDCFSVDAFCSHCNNAFQAMGCFYHLFTCQEVRPSLTEEDIQRGSKRDSSMNWDEAIYQKKSLTVIEMWECEGWRLYKTNNNVKKHFRENFLYRRSLAAEELKEMKNRKIFGYVQCYVEVPQILRAIFTFFPPVFKNTLANKNDICDLMKTYPEEEGILSQPRKLLI